LSIYKAKEALTAISRKFGIKAIFFDGRGTPARGEENAQILCSLGPNRKTTNPDNSSRANN
jgi:phosphoenolpyruvate carboxylase